VEVSLPGLSENLFPWATRTVYEQGLLMDRSAFLVIKDWRIPDHSGQSQFQHDATGCMCMWSSFYPLCRYHDGGPEIFIV